MIADQLSNVGFYRALHPRLARGFDFLRNTDLFKLPLGRNEIDGDSLFAIVAEYTTKPLDQCFWEAHRKYCDIQFIVSGIEHIGVANVARLSVKKPYDAQQDAVFLDGTGDTLTLPAGSFAVFAPQDAHMCCIADGVPGPIRKVVVKVAIDS